MFTDGSKSEAGVGSAAYCPTAPTEERSKHMCSDSSVYTAELRALSLALKTINTSAHKEFLIFLDSLSALQAIAGRNLNHPLLQKFFHRYTLLYKKGIQIVLAWVPGHVGI